MKVSPTPQLMLRCPLWEASSTIFSHKLFLSLWHTEIFTFTHDSPALQLAPWFPLTADKILSSEQRPNVNDPWPSSNSWLHSKSCAYPMWVEGQFLHSIWLPCSLQSCWHIICISWHDEKNKSFEEEQTWIWLLANPISGWPWVHHFNPLNSGSFICQKWQSLCLRVASRKSGNKDENWAS